MIVNNPINYLHDLKFYQDLMSSMNLDASNLVVAPCSSTFIFTSAASNTFYDIYSQRVVSVTGYRNFFLGSLYLRNYCSAFTAAGSIEAIIQTNGLSWPIEFRDVAGVDTQYGNDRGFDFDSVLFSLLRINLTGTLTYAIKGIFTGVKISY